MTHLTEDELVLHYYGEMTAAEEAQAAASPRRRARACHDDLRRLQRVLAVVDESALVGPELPEQFERTVWARLEPNLRRFASRLVVVVRAVAGAARVDCRDRRARRRRHSWPAVCVPRSNDAAITPTAARADPARRSRRAPRSLADGARRARERRRRRARRHLGRTRTRRAPGGSQPAVSADRGRDWRRRHRAICSTSSSACSWISRPARKRSRRRSWTTVRHRIESRSLLFKVRVISSEIRQRQQSIVQERAGSRSSL